MSTVAMRFNRSPTRRQLHLVAALVALPILIGIGGDAMAFGQRPVLFSEVHGRLVRDGQPVVGATIVQVIERDGQDEILERVTTDINGQFILTTKHQSGWFWRVFPGEISIAQSIYVSTESERRLMWSNLRRNARMNGEAEGKPLRVECEWNAEPRRGAPWFGRCRLVDD